MPTRMGWIARVLPGFVEAKTPSEAGICLQKDNKAVTQCAKDAKECAGLRYSYYQCKRGQLDNRNRITGNKGY